MIIRSARFLLAAALAGGTLSCAASTDCPKKPQYPREALKREEAGISLVAFLVRPDGTVIRSIVLNSSGSEDLDREVQDVLGRCVFQLPSVPIGSEGFWSPIGYTWLLDDDPELLQPRQEAAVAARKGDLDALFRLSRLLSSTKATDADRKNALVVLRGAADKGHAAAQFALGRRYETGDGVEKNPDEAMRWYEKARAQGDVLAEQRLRLGKLFD
jgi:TonB family protein